MRLGADLVDLPLPVGAAALGALHLAVGAVAGAALQARATRPGAAGAPVVPVGAEPAVRPHLLHPRGPGSGLQAEAAVGHFGSWRWWACQRLLIGSIRSFQIGKGLECGTLKILSGIARVCVP